jgi:hypothetical protein
VSDVLELTVDVQWQSGACAHITWRPGELPTIGATWRSADDRQVVHSWQPSCAALAAWLGGLVPATEPEAARPLANVIPITSARRGR